MRALLTATLMVVSTASLAENTVPMPEYDSDKICREIFASKAPNQRSDLLKECLESEQRHYNLSRVVWDYLTPDSAQFCVDNMKRVQTNAEHVRIMNYQGLPNPYTQLWSCISLRMKIDEAKRPPRPFQKW